MLFLAPFLCSADQDAAWSGCTDGGLILIPVNEVLGTDFPSRPTATNPNDGFPNYPGKE